MTPTPSAPTRDAPTRVDRLLPVDPSSVAEARAALDAFADEVGDTVLDAARLLISELVTNAVRHGPPGSTGPVRVAIDHDGHRLRAEVRDGGPGFVRPTDPREVGGWGLVLVEELSDRWAIARGEPTTVWFEIDTTPRTRTPAAGWPPEIDSLLLERERAAVIATDRDGIVTRWNTHAAELFGYPAAEAVGRGVVGLLVRPDDVRSERTIRARLVTGEPWEGEWLAARKDRSSVWVRIATTPVHDDAGRMLGMLAVALDISERRSAQRALEDSEERLRIALESGRMGTWAWGLGDGVVTWSESLERIHGIEPGTFGGTFEDFQRDMHPEDRGRVLGSIERAMQDGLEYGLDYRIVRPSDGGIRWLSVRGRVLRDDDGRPTGMVGVCADITERKEAERSLAVQYAVSRVLEGAPTLEEAAPRLLATIGEALAWEVGTVWRVDRDADVLRPVATWRADDAVGAAFVERTEATTFARGEGLPGRIWASGGRLWVDDFSNDASFPRAGVALTDGLHASFGFPIALGEEVLGVVEFLSRRFREPDEALLELVGAVGAQVGRFMAERGTREQLERARERAAFVADASVMLARSLDPTETMRALARLCVPGIADLCSVDVVDPEGRFETLAVEHVDPHQVRLLEDHRRRWPSRIGDGGVLDRVASSGSPVLVADLTPEVVGEIVEDPERRELMARLDLRSLMVVPLAARGRTIGAISFLSAGSGRRFAEDDLDLAQDLARRAGLAFDNARLYEERSHIAKTLQRTLLPRELPTPPGMEVAALYQASSLSHTEVGGDFYDVFECIDGSWTVIIGDVCGKGVEAAALTGMARHTLRAAGARGGAPAEALEDLNRVMLREDGERFCTVAFGRLVPDGARTRLHVSCGGHPPPLIVRPSGEVEEVGAPGSLLGVFEDVGFEERSTSLGAGDIAIFYTDGLIDARASAPLDERALADLVSGCAGRTASEAVGLISSAVTDPDARTSDDTCVLVVRVTG